MKMREVCVGAIGVLSLAVVPHIAAAATVTLDLTSLGTTMLGVGEAKTVTLGGSATEAGLAVTLVGMSYDGTTIGTSKAGGQRVISGFAGNAHQSALTFSGYGAGVRNPAESFTIPGLFSINFDSYSADTGGGYADYFEIFLSQSATLTGAGFTDFYTTHGFLPKSKSSFVWAADTTGDGAIGDGDIISAATKLTEAGTSFDGTSSTAFLIGAAGQNSEWQLRYLTLDYQPQMISSVPLPASGSLMLGAFIGFGAFRRRRRHA